MFSIKFFYLYSLKYMRLLFAAILQASQNFTNKSIDFFFNLV